MDDKKQGEKIDPYKLRVKNPETTFFPQAEEENTFLGIRKGDLIVCDRAAEALDGKTVIADMDGDLSLWRLARKDGKAYLLGEEREKEITGREHVFIWGVVTWILREG